MATNQDVVKRICPLCKKELPFLKEDGHHNFCPHSLEDGKIIDIFITCKMMSIDGRWQI
ncbi:MAG: hypothetical protein HY005_00530 [Candidatus Staskawiczbacteria bacterium]|nr:hypothetical protein [Candidatus Staskawiczbacteria bacterium]